VEPIDDSILYTVPAGTSFRNSICQSGRPGLFSSRIGGLILLFSSYFNGVFGFGCLIEAYSNSPD
jgi:hypothetical protein